MRAVFEEQLKKLNNAIIKMGEIVEQAIAGANKALFEQDVDLAARIIAGDDLIDNAEKDIERLCLKLLLQQQPVAGDLRLVSAALKVTTDLERIGDHATDISKITIRLAEQKYIKKLEHIPQMAEATIKMVSESIEAFVNRDIELAKKVIDYDDVVDDLFIVVKNDLIELIKQNPSTCDQAIELIMIAKYFERIGDHATNVAEWVIFTLTGTRKDSKLL